MSVSQCESCSCVWGPGHFCAGTVGTDAKKYLEGDDCHLGELYNCPAKDLDAESIDHCAQNKCLQTQPGAAHCPGGFL